MGPLTTNMKTVKVLSANQDSLENRLNALHKHFETFEEDNMRRFEALENRIKLMESIIINLQDETHNKEKSVKPISCAFCQLKFKKAKDLEEHIATEHDRMFKCNYCAEEFDLQWKLELHVQTHVQVDKLNCGKCDINFHLKWRLVKHTRLHGNSNVKCFYYYNNHKHCPYVELGCKFRHVDATYCKFQAKCFRKLCPNKHEHVEEMISDIDENTDEQPTVDVDKMCDEILKNATHVSNIVEEDSILSESFIDNVMNERERKADKIESEENEESIEKYFPDCKECNSEKQDCIACIMKHIKQSDDVDTDNEDF